MGVAPHDTATPLCQKEKGVALSGGCHALSPQKAYFVEFYGRADGLWLLAFYDLSRRLF